MIVLLISIVLFSARFPLCGTKPGCGVLGLANLDGACTEHNVAIVKDFGGFGGIMTAAHELGHTYVEYFVNIISGNDDL